jgi:transcriptional regulator with XRE-family HTH domain
VTADLGATLARIRLANNITQQALATRAGVAVRTLRRLEAGHGGTLDTLIRLMQALRLENHLQGLLPDPGIRPVERLELGGRERQRARALPPSAQKPWTWDEEQVP